MSYRRPCQPAWMALLCGSLSPIGEGSCGIPKHGSQREVLLFQRLALRLEACHKLALASLSPGGTRARPVDSLLTSSPGRKEVERQKREEHDYEPSHWSCLRHFFEPRCTGRMFCPDQQE